MNFFFLQFYNNLCLGYNFGESYKYSMTCYMKDKSKCIILLIFPEYFKEYKTSYNTTIRPVTYYFLGGLSLHLNHLIAWQRGNFFLAIWDTSHWNFFVKFGLKTPYDIS